MTLALSGVICYSSVLCGLTDDLVFNVQNDPSKVTVVTSVCSSAMTSALLTTCDCICEFSRHISRLWGDSSVKADVIHWQTVSMSRAYALYLTMQRQFPIYGHNYFHMSRNTVNIHTHAHSYTHTQLCLLSGFYCQEMLNCFYMVQYCKI